MSFCLFFILNPFTLQKMNNRVIILGVGAGLAIALAFMLFAQENVVVVRDEDYDDSHRIVLDTPPEPIELKQLTRFNMARGRSTRFYFKDDVFSGRGLFDDPCMNAYTRKPFVLPQTVYISQQVRLRNKAPPYGY